MDLTIARKGTRASGKYWSDMQGKQWTRITSINSHKTKSIIFKHLDLTKHSLKF